MQALHPTSRSLGRIVSILVCLCFVAVTANAYTVIMRGGRRVEIPRSFVLTPSTLTYQVSAGVQITLNLAAIDIPATEIANKEPPGSLLRRIAALIESGPPIPQEFFGPRAGTVKQSRTITNRDLESSMLRRRESELAYERRRKELGLLSAEESRRKAAAESASIALDMQEMRASERESESYWRNRATALRTEMAEMDAQILYVRSQLEQPSSSSGSFSSIALVPFISFGNIAGHGRFPGHPRVFGSPTAGAQLRGRVVFAGGSTRGRVFPRGGFGLSHGFSSTVFASPSFFGGYADPFAYSDERSQLITRFNELGTLRAGLNARWRELEEEARRAGAAPGWLRP